MNRSALARVASGRVAVAVACATIALITPLGPVRVVGALPLCLWLPGRALSDAMFPGVAWDPSRRALLALALSLSTLVCGSLVLNLIPGGGLRAGWWALLLVSVVAVAATVAPSPPSPTDADAGQPAGRARLHVPVFGVATVLVAVAVAVAAYVGSKRALPVPNAIGFAELSITQALGGHGFAVTVASDSQHPLRVRLTLTISGRTETARVFTLLPAHRYTVTQPIPGASHPQQVAAVVATNRGGRPLRVELALPATD